MIGIMVLSVLLLIWHGKYGQKRINLPFISLLFGGIWAAHIALKYPALGHYDFSFLLISLLSVLFIGSIAFAANIVAFTLYSLPPVAVCLWLNGNEQGLRILYLLALPMVGIAIQHVIQKRYDNFAQQLMFKLLAERETLNGLSMLDPLTGLYNRRGLQNRLDTLQAPGSHEHYVLLLDIDHFKAYNDHYGHMMGDQALIRVSAAIRDAVRSRDVVCRFGGEEFLVLLTTAEPQQARATAERIRQEVYDLKIPHMFNESVATNVTVSIGIAPWRIAISETLSKKRIKRSTKPSILDVTTFWSATTCAPYESCWRNRATPTALTINRLPSFIAIDRISNHYHLD